jgi:flagellar motor switch protein FliN/FliY
MTQTLAAPADRLLNTATAAAEAALGAVPADYPLTAGTPTTDRSAVPGGQAIVAAFSGSVSGTLVLVISNTVAQALAGSPLGQLDPAEALRPALEAAAGAIGRVSLAQGRVDDVDTALTALLAEPAAVLVPLIGDGAAQGALGLSMAAVPESTTGGDAVLGLDVLRGVEVEVTAELGRTTMLLDEQLSLRDGAVIELDRAAGSPADLLVNGRLIARGEVVVVDENFGLRITEIVPDGSAR